MSNKYRCAKINVKVLIVCIIIVVAIITSLFAARQVRRGILSKISLQSGETAFEKQDWPIACRNFREYLSRNPDDVEILKKYAKAAISIRPLNADAVRGAISAYRRIMQLDFLDEVAYDKLAMLYEGMGNYEELAYVARTRIEYVSNDPNAPLWLAKALFHLGKTGMAREELDKYIKSFDKTPNKTDEFVQACALMSKVILADNINNTIEARTPALEYLNRAVENVPNSIHAHANRARFYRDTSEIPGLSEKEVQDNLTDARNDLVEADKLGTEDPRALLFLGAEWMEHGELDKAEAELRASDKLTKEKLEEHFFDMNDWIVNKFIFASKLTVSQVAKKKKAVNEDVSLADNVLTELKEKSYRFRVLPSAIMFYLATNNVSKASQYLDEYLKAMYSQENNTLSKLQVAYLQALVAMAEEKPYAVINVLQPAVVTDSDRPELWQLLSEAFIKTDQYRRAASALTNYLRLKPKDAKMTAQLAKVYLKLQNWSKAFDTAKLAESQNPTEIIIQLLRIETSIYVATEQTDSVNITGLKKSSADLEELSKKNSNLVHIRILQAIIDEKLDEPYKAEAELKSAIEQCDEPLLAKIQLIRFYSRSKRMDEALSVCRDACKNDPNVADPWLSLSGIYVTNKDYDSARKCLQEGLDAVTSKWQKRSLSIRLALLEYLYGDRNTAINILGEVAAQNEQDIRARSLLLSMREVREDRPKAEKLIEELQKAEGRNGLFWRLYQASLWLSSDQWRSKQQDITDNLQYCINLDPEWSSPVLLLAEMYNKLEDYTHVEDTCRKALSRNSSVTEVADVLVSLYEKQNRHPDAEEVLKQIEKNTRVVRNWASARHVGIALNAGNYSQAIEELKLRVQGNDQDVDSRILLARLVYWNGDAEQAFELLKEAEALEPDSRTLIAAKVAILRAEGKDEQAQQILDDYVASRDDFRAYAMRAAYLSDKGQFELAEKDYKKLTTLAGQEMSGYEYLSNFYARNQKLDQAIKTLEEGLSKYPGNLKLSRRLMKMLFLPGPTQDIQKVTEILTALEKQLPQDPELMKIEAIQMLQTPTPENVQTARQKLQQVVKLEPTAVDAHLLLIDIAIQEHRYADVRDLAVRALGANPDNPAFLSARALAELKLENTQMAAQLVQMAMQKDPNNIQARNLLITVALQTKDPDLLEQSRILIESESGNDPNNEQLLLKRASILVSMNNPQAAIPELEAYYLTEKGKDSINALVTLADLYRFSGKMNKANQWIGKAEQLDPNSLTVIHARFMWLADQKKLDELLQYCSFYLSAKGLNSKAIIEAAKKLALMNSMELNKEAVKFFDKAVALAPTSEEALLGLAMAMHQIGDIKKEQQAYQKVLEQYPNNIQAINNLAWILQERDNRYDEALELINRGLKQPLDENVHLYLLDTRGTILSNMKDRLTDAKNDFQTIVDKSSDDTRQKAKALFKLGLICSELNDLTQAEQHLKEALEIDKKINVFTPEERSEITGFLDKSGTQAVSRDMEKAKSPL
jgi:tetratricopeptide (TPR) repeat protein